jgi:DNA polymerase-3 subunit delta'
MRFPDIVGHEEQKQTLANAIERDRVHHAYLFTGPDGIGKRRVAYAFIARMMCRSREANGEACGVCRQCKRIFETPAWYDTKGVFTSKDDAPELAPRHPDVLTLVAHGNFIKISQVREALRVIPFQPVEGELRVVVIDEAHAMNDEAANALLKTLEEPPSRTRFIVLSSQPSNLLVTIRSRCQRVSFSRLSEGDLRTVLTRSAVDPTLFDEILPLAGGSAKLAIGLANDPVVKLWGPLAERIIAVATAEVRAPSLAPIHELAAALAEVNERDALFDRLGFLLRDLLLLRSGAAGDGTGLGGQTLFHAHLREGLTSWATALNIEGILHRLELVEDTRVLTRTFNLQARLAFERLLLAMLAPAGQERSRPLLDRRDVL